MRIKKGALHRQLGIPQGVRIPTRLLVAIKNAEIGETITNPTSMGKRRIKVTKLLKKRVVFALNFGHRRSRDRVEEMHRRLYKALIG